MSEETLVLEKAEFTTYYTDGRPAYVSTLGISGNALKEKKEPELKADQTGSKPWSPWGSDNMFPNQVMEDLRLSTVGKRILSNRAHTHVGSDLIYYRIEVDDKGKRNKLPLYIPEIEDFLEENNVWAKQKAIVEDLETFYNAFAQLHFRRDGKKAVAGYSAKKSIFSRVEKMNPSSRRIENLYYSYTWPNPKEAEFTKIPMFDSDNPERFPICVVPLKYSTSDNTIYYELAIWDSVRQNGWMEVDRMVPELKKYMLKNQSIIKYHIKIPFSYWERKYGKETWVKYTAPEKDAKIAQELASLDTFLKGVSNTGKSFISGYDIDKITGKENSGWIIEALDHKIQDGIHLLDTSAAYSAILFAMGYDPTLIGANLIDKRSSGGSGSDKRESLHNLQASMPVDRSVSLEPLRIITRINGWNNTYAKELNNGRIHWAYADAEGQTLDQNPTGKTNVLK